jgi:hypothetical protein
MVGFIDEFYQFFDELKIKYMGFCNSVLLSITNDDINSIENTKRSYGILEKDTFNIFEPLENYQKEAFNEIILTQILDPKTKEIGNIEFLNIFCELLSEKVKYCFGNSVIVENQKGGIDILIHDEHNAIIVESKINNAIDQKNQLARYFRYVKNELKKTVLAIVYIRPIYNEYKLPPLETYELEYESETIEVRDILVPISVIASKCENDLCHGFLDKCSRKTMNEKARVYIQQYSELLKLKGGSKMLTNIEKEMLKKLYSDEESVKKMQVIIEIWNNRWEIFAAIIKDSLHQMGFGPGDGDEQCTAKSITEKISVVFTDYDNTDWGFGFWYKEGTSKKLQDVLSNLLKSYNNKLLDTEIENTDNRFIGKRFILEIDKPINEIIDILHKMYKELEKMAVEELK